jgi:hypothetical protein
MGNKTYSDLLHASARLWGLSVPEEWPLIDDHTSPYPNPSVVEMFAWKGEHGWEWANIEILTLNDRWSFAAQFSTWKHGAGFGPWLKFCDPFATREDALAAAVTWLRGHGAAEEKGLNAWLNQLQWPQLTLFALEMMP